MPQRNEVHVCLADNGHISSIDCWCEPVNIRWIRNKHGVDVLVVEHDDETLQDRDIVLFNREVNRNSNLYGAPMVDQPWITRVLTPPFTPPLLPPHDPNERTI